MSAHWTPEAKAFVKKRWADGASASVIAAELGTTRNAIIGRVHRSGLPKRPTDSQAAVQRLRRIIAVKAAPRESVQKSEPPRTPYIEPAYIPVDPIRFLDRHMFDQCAFIPGDPRMGARAPEIMCCGAKTVKNSSWCQQHFALVYQPEKKRERGGFVLFPRAA